MTNEADIAKISTHCRCCPDVIAAWAAVQNRLTEQRAELERLKADRQALLDASAKTGQLVMDQGAQTIGQRAEITRLRAVLVLLDTSGGLGVDRHEWIREALAAERREEKHVRGT